MPAYDAPPYTAPFTPKVLTPGRPVLVWDAEAIATGDKSSQFCMHRSHLPQALSVQILFDGDPGDFEIDLQTADVDDDAYYVTKVSVDQTGMNASFAARIESLDVVAKFARLKMVLMTNAVNTTATIY